MSNELLIEAKGLTKAYRIWDRPSSRLTVPLIEAASASCPGVGRRTLRRAGRPPSTATSTRFATWASRCAAARPPGIIGRNGSGKSTLLQLIAGTLMPTSGTVSSRAGSRRSSSSEAASTPTSRGRENVFLNGAIYGFTHGEMASRMDEITAFADIGDFLDQPVKTYSSGMMMRLAFAVAVNVQPDVLIIDEALAVGDVFFSQKCFQRIREIVHRGATLIFVSHDMGAVQSLCDRALLLSQGSLDLRRRPGGLRQPVLQPAQAGARGAGRAVAGHASRPWTRPRGRPSEALTCPALPPSPGTATGTSRSRPRSSSTATGPRPGTLR